MSEEDNSSVGEYDSGDSFIDNSFDSEDEKPKKRGIPTNKGKPVKKGGVKVEKVEY